MPQTPNWLRFCWTLIIISEILFKEKLSDFNDENSSCFVFIFAINLYWLRCDSMHGEHGYEVFESKDVFETTVKVYDFFEDVIIKVILFVCSEN